ncbi:Increased recombination centers protein 22 [Neolecta irregularis DAH-3]|uniref:Increased recombination centers protein 22 n=1 Tax=Neolecta irregularis (strain DAH-3) TaxID=1198029 RepID=A0A1U7LKH7_NEOID|nr:Increased recombination centers protein 22 [Neolecta irregularis DAH-3]|eukprot:OLL23149.1 Increased recombination centers protein 22 [Neolecta irregularis DAH-3]
MKLFLFSLALLCLKAFAEETSGPAEPVDSAQSSSKQVEIAVSASFPDAPLAASLENSQKNRVIITVVNNEPQIPIVVDKIGGYLWEPLNAAKIHTLLGVKTTTEIGPRESKEFSYEFNVDTRPGKVGLNLAIVFKREDQVLQKNAYNSTIPLNEPPASIFDPQMLFLYLFIATIVSGLGYYAYSTLYGSLFPDSKRKRPKKTGAVLKQKDPNVLDEDWLPVEKSPSLKRRDISRGKILKGKNETKSE